MTKAQMKKETHRMYNEVFLKIISYLTGPKFNGKYSIDCLKAQTASRKIIVENGFGGYRIMLYFDYRIRISLRNSFYGYDVFRDFAVNPDFENSDEYVYMLSEFLRKLIWCSQHVGPHYNPCFPKLQDDCPDTLKEALISADSFIRHPWADDNMKDLRYAITFTKGRSFHRAVTGK